MRVSMGVFAVLRVSEVFSLIGWRITVLGVKHWCSVWGLLISYLWWSSGFWLLPQFRSSAKTVRNRFALLSENSLVFKLNAELHVIESLTVFE